MGSGKKSNLILFFLNWSFLYNFKKLEESFATFFIFFMDLKATPLTLYSVGWLLMYILTEKYMSAIL